MKKNGRIMSALLAVMMIMSLNTAYTSADTYITYSEKETLGTDNSVGEGIFKVTLQGENTYYNDFGEALEASRNGGIITLQADHSSKENYVISGNVTLDLNGHTWTVPEYDNEPTFVSADQIDSSGSIDYDYPITNSLFYVLSGGSFTVTDSSEGNGSIINRNDVLNSITTFYDSTLNINGGNYIMAPGAYRNIRTASVQTYEGNVYVSKGNFDVDMTNCDMSGASSYGTLFGGLILAVGRGESVIENCNASYVYIGDNTSAASNFAIKTGNYDEIEFLINTTDPEGFKTALLSNFSRNGTEVYINNNQLTNSDLYMYSSYENNFWMNLKNVSVTRSESYVDWSTENEDTLIFNSNIPDYQGNGQPWSHLKDKICTVVLNKDCRSVGEYSFDGFTALSTVVIANSETDFSYTAFSGCNNISHIHLPCGSSIFEYCGRGGLPTDYNKFVVIDESGSCPYSNCPVKVSDNIETEGMCGASAYWELNNETLYIKGSGEMYNYYIDEYTRETAPWYEYREQIKNISISDSIERIGGYSFYGFSNVTSVNIPENVMGIGHCAFGNMNGLKYVTVNRAYDNLYISDDVFKGSENISHIHIPSGSNIYYYRGMGGLPTDERLYFVLDADGYCSDSNCPMGMSKPHEHDYGSEYQSDSEYHWRQCECGEKTDQAAHSYDSGVITVQPTEQTDGEMTYTCSICSYQKTESIPKLEHTHSYGTEWKSDSDNHWHECKCGDKKDSEKHISDGGVVTVQPTETTEGTMTYSCTVCGYVIRTESIPVLEALPSITFESGNVETAEGLSADFSIKAEGKGLIYCWKTLVNGSFEEVGCISESLHIETAEDSRTFICVVTDKNGKTVTSSELKLTVIGAEDVSAEYVNKMSVEECIKFVNYFSSVNEDNIILTDGMMAAVERVLIHDGIL